MTHDYLYWLLIGQKHKKRLRAKQTVSSVMNHYHQPMVVRVCMHACVCVLIFYLECTCSSTSISK